MNLGSVTVSLLFCVLYSYWSVVKADGDTFWTGSTLQFSWIACFFSSLPVSYVHAFLPLLHSTFETCVCVPQVSWTNRTRYCLALPHNSALSPKSKRIALNSLWVFDRNRFFFPGWEIISQFSLKTKETYLLDYTDQPLAEKHHYTSYLVLNERLGYISNICIWKTKKHLYFYDIFLTLDI